MQKLERGYALHTYLL